MSTPLDGAPFLDVETFKKDGSGVKTPVWAASLDGKLVFHTGARMYKVKRIRNNPHVRVAGCNSTGRKVLTPWYEGTARLIDGPQARKAEAALARKYGFMRKLYYAYARLTGEMKDSTYVEISVGEPTS